MNCADGPTLSLWNRVFRESEMHARELMSDRRWQYSGEFEDVTRGFGGRSVLGCIIGSIFDLKACIFREDFCLSPWIQNLGVFGVMRGNIC